MKLSALNTAIRKADKVSIWTRLPGGPLLVAVQKTSLLEALKAKYAGDRNAETDLTVRDDGQLIAEDPNLFPGDPAQQQSYEAQHAALHTAEVDDDEDPFATPVDADDLDDLFS